VEDAEATEVIIDLRVGSLFPTPLHPDMPPAFTAEYSANLGLANSDTFGDAMLRQSSFAEIKDAMDIFLT
jgi:hypothetical protein